MSNLPTRDPSPLSQMSISSKNPNSLSIVIIEAVFLSCKVMEQPSIKYSRPLYMSPSFLDSGLIKGEWGGYEDTLHLLSDTFCQFEVLLRIIDRQTRTSLSSSLLCHEANITSNGVVTNLSITCSGEIRDYLMDSSIAYLVSFPETIIRQEESQKRKRLQIYDQDRRLLFTKEWQIDVGKLSEDAISWLKDSSIDLYKLANLKSTNNSAFTEDQTVAIDTLKPPIQNNSRDGSISTSFVNLGDYSRNDVLFSRSNSASTIYSHINSEESTLEGPPKTVDLLQQLGFWIYGSKVGQMIANYDLSDNLKLIYSESPIWILGKRFQNDRPEFSFPKVVALNPIKEIESYQCPFKYIDPLSICINPKTYSLWESFYTIATDQEQLLVFEFLKTWLIDAGWQCVTTNMEVGACSINAMDPKSSITFSIDAFRYQSGSMIICSIESSTSRYPQAKTIYVDCISEMVNQFNNASRKILFVQLIVNGTNMVLGPHPNPLIPFLKSPSPYHQDDLLLPNSTLQINLLLWSEHIHDWVLRRLRVQKGESHVELLSTELSQNPMIVSLSACSVYLFADSTLRFALLKKNSWLCFRCFNSNDFQAITRIIPELMSSTNLIEKDAYSSSLETSSRSNSETSSIILPGKIPNPKMTKSTSLDFNNLPGISEFLDEFECRFWFTYRKDFLRLAPSILSSDAGFGCMLRAGQSMVAEALSQLWLKEKRHPKDIFVDPDLLLQYKLILSIFIDTLDPSAILSIHNLTIVGADLGTPIGQYFSPSILARVLQKQCKLRNDIPFSIYLVKQGVINLVALSANVKSMPQLLLISLRLGAETFNPDYGPLIKASLGTSLSVGIVGGRQSRAFYIVGYQDNSLLYLDPHYLRATNLNLEKAVEDREYHSRAVCELSMSQLDPTVLLGFLCKSEADLDSLVQILTLVSVPMPIFSIVRN